MMLEFLTEKEIAKFFPKEKIIYSLKCGKFQGGGQSLKMLTISGFGKYNEENKEATQKVLYKMKQKYLVCYFRKTKVWCIF